MRRLTQIFQALLGVVALILTTIIAAGRLVWRTIRKWWKNRSKWVRRVIAIVVPVGIVTLIAYNYYDREYGRCNWMDDYLSEYVEIHGFRDRTYRLYNNVTEEYTTGKVNWVSAPSNGDSLTVYALPHRRGYINANTGEVVIDALENTYEKGWVFSEGMAAVMKDGKVGFINVDNEVVISFRFDYSEKNTIYDFGYVFHDGYCLMTDVDGNLGLIDTLGNWVVTPVYDEIWELEPEGFRIVLKDEYYGVLDSLGREVYPAEYRYSRIDSNGVVLVKDGRMWKMDFDGNIVQPFLYDNIIYLKCRDGYIDDDVNYLLADYVKYEVMDLYGIMHRITGKPITPAIYSDIRMVSKNLFEVNEAGCYEWYLLDTRGNKVNK